MSDFDKEAERERLREKYEKDKEKRKSTQRMSELLLKGATMTNQHCDECGSPIFRHDGREFCPTCQGAGASVVDAEGATDAPGTGQTPTGTAAENTREVGAGPDAPEADDAAQAEESTSAGASDVAVHTPEDDAAADTADPNATDPERTAGTGAPGRRGDERGRQGSESGSPTDVPTGSGADAAGRSSANANPTADAGSNAGGADETTAGAREALLRALRTHADRAADEADPRRASDHLAAAREAAEALSALDRR